MVLQVVLALTFQFKSSHRLRLRLEFISKQLRLFPLPFSLKPLFLWLSIGHRPWRRVVLYSWPLLQAQSWHPLHMHRRYPLLPLPSVGPLYKLWKAGVLSRSSLRALTGQHPHGVFLSLLLGSFFSPFSFSGPAALSFFGLKVVSVVLVAVSLHIAGVCLPLGMRVLPLLVYVLFVGGRCSLVSLACAYGLLALSKAPDPTGMEGEERWQWPSCCLRCYAGRWNLLEDA